MNTRRSGDQDIQETSQGAQAAAPVLAEEATGAASTQTQTAPPEPEPVSVQGGSEVDAQTMSVGGTMVDPEGTTEGNVESAQATDGEVSSEEMESTGQTSPMSESFSETAPTGQLDGTAHDADAQTNNAAEPTPGLIVANTADEVGAGQMKKSEFLLQLQSSVRHTAEGALAGTGRSARDCPYITYWFGYYENRSSQYIERAIHRYAPETMQARTASDYISLINQHVLRAVEVWVATGEVTGVPEGVPRQLPGDSSTPQGGGSLPGALDAVSFKGSNGDARRSDDPHLNRAALGSGSALDPSVRARMEPAFNADLSHVRVHTDTDAAGLSSRHDARAFTVGEHIAFGAGEYKPGTLVGDALIAHELAHVMQQGGATSARAEGGMYGALEEDADKSAVGAVVSIWDKGKGALASMAQNSMPSLRSGLRLQRCGRNTPPPAQRCIFPTSVQNGPRHAPINNATQAGMEIDITIIPSSGNAADLAGVEDSEQVSSTFDHTGSMVGRAPIVPSTSSFMDAASVPPDRHAASKTFLLDRADNHGGSGSFALQQLDIFKHTACGVTTPRVIPNSGYRINHTITKGAGTLVEFTVEKRPEACTVNGFTAAAGPSASQFETVVVRP